MSNLVLKSWATVAAALVLVSCGGGGGGGENAPAPPPVVVPGPPAGPPAGPTHSLSGSILLAETSAVDSDSNSASQVGRARNDSFDTTQSLRTPVLLLGSVNVAGTGPTGPNFTGGDELDHFTVVLEQGQVVELDFAADTLANDLDLYVSRNDGEIIGSSIGENSYECVRIATSGTYVVSVNAFAGASVYNLRIGAPSANSSCANSTSGLTRILPGQVVAKALPATVKTARSSVSPSAVNSPSATTLTRTLTAAGLAADTVVGSDAPSLLIMPPPGRARTAALQRLSGSAATAPASSTTTAAAADKVPAALRELMETVAYAKRLARSGQFAYAEPNRTSSLQAIVGTYPPSDRLYANQRWHYEMINLPSAMARVTGLATQPAARPLVAVIDSGIVADHPDLAAQIQGQRSFVSGSSTPSTASADDFSLPDDRSGFHGTHVAGTIGAVTFDGSGVAAVAPMAQLLPIRVFPHGSEIVNGEADASGFDLTQAILYAARLTNSSGTLPARRADVINLSLGSESACPAAFADAIARARAAGVIVVAAAGNNSGAALLSPANCPGVISVGAVDARRGKSFYSNTSSSLTVAAPGGDQRVSTTGSGLPDYIYSTLGDFTSSGQRVPSFGGLQGTSMATPHVVGVMALMRYVHPAITVAQIDALFTSGKLTDDLGTAGRDISFGHGLINARKAVDEALALAGGAPAPTVGTVVALPSSLDFGSVRTTAEIELRVNAASTERVLSIVSNSPAVTVAARTIDATTRLGSYTVTVDRSSLPLGGTFVTLTVTTNTGQFDVQISVQKVASGASAAANFGRVVVLLVNPANNAVINQQEVNAVNGRYSWSFSGVTQTRVQVVAGTDTDNDRLLCARGEACGAYPQLGANLTVIDLSTNRTGLDFEIVPLGGSSAAASLATVTGSGAGGSAAASVGWRLPP
ncbi:MAG: hypothetical protein RLZZ618_539 [Pseudomonadota bacterium]|jgi:serine protease